MGYRYFIYNCLLKHGLSHPKALLQTYIFFGCKSPNMISLASFIASSVALLYLGSLISKGGSLSSINFLRKIVKFSLENKEKFQYL